MHLPAETLRYIISFLLCSDKEEDLSLIAYTSDPSEYRGHPLAILPASLIPNPHVVYIDECPIFHGIPSVRRDGDTIILQADIIATTFYLLSRYDEYDSTAPLDIHSRFLPENSLLGSNGLLTTPVLDIYTEYIYKLLGRTKPKRRSHIYLTHDIDSVTCYRSARGFIGGLYRLMNGTNPDRLSTIIKSLINRTNDPKYTFPRLQNIDAGLPNAEVLYFVKPDNVPFSPLDRPIYSHKSSDFRTLENLPIGLHSLYSTYDYPDSLSNQFAAIKRLPHNNNYHRSHYLRILPPTEMHRYSDAGITDDFTLAFASAPGFRLGTTRPSRAIDPSTDVLLPLILHPITIMDTTLSDTQYLHLSEQEAVEISLSLIDTALKHEGDIVLLFHNASLREGSYHGNLYTTLIKYLKDK